MVCKPPDGVAPPKKQRELWKCMKKANCPVIDDRLQMAILRDPRPMAVSAYFHQVLHDSPRVRGVSVDEFALSLLPVVCKWLSVRYFFFAELFKANSAIFWYDDALADPIEWHRMLFSLVGLRLPPFVGEKAARVNAGSVAGRRTFGFPVKGIDKHEGGRDASKDRTFRDEVNSTTISSMDNILRVWLPPIVLHKLGVMP